MPRIRVDADPRAVLLSDVHYSLPTLALADAATRQAIEHAKKLDVPLIIAGDLHDTKGAMRAECVNAMLETFELAPKRTYVLVGNHCRINEKDKPHALNFLKHLVDVVQAPVNISINSHKLYLFPYENDTAVLTAALKPVPAGATLIMHTGVLGAFMGHYTQDKSSLPPDLYHGLRVISGHYHRRQDIPLPGGLFSYIGNPYTLNFAEAFDPPKGFQVLNNDGTLTFVPTNLRKHVVIDSRWDAVFNTQIEVMPGDLIKAIVRGPASELSKITRQALGDALFGHHNFTLDLVPDKAPTAAKPTQSPKLPPQVLDDIIEGLPESLERKDLLKQLWRSLV